MASCDWRYTGAPTAPTLRKYMAVLPEKSSKHGSSTNKTMGISRKNISSWLWSPHRLHQYGGILVTECPIGCWVNVGMFFCLTVSLTHQMCVIMCIIQFNMDQWGWSFLDAKPRPMLNLTPEVHYLFPTEASAYWGLTAECYQFKCYLSIPVGIFPCS